MSRKYFKWISNDLYAFLITLKKWYNTFLGIGTITTGAVLDSSDVNLINLINPKFLYIVAAVFLFLGIFLESYKKDNFDE